jgi:hypothetical protein
VQDGRPFLLGLIDVEELRKEQVDGCGLMVDGKAPEPSTRNGSEKQEERRRLNEKDGSD